MLQFLKICHYPCHLRGEMERPLYSWTCWCSPASLSSLIIPNFFYFLFIPGPRWIIYCTYNITLDLVHAAPSLSFEKKINAWRSSYFIYLYFLKFEIFTCVYTYMCATVLLWRSLDNFGGLMINFHIYAFFEALRCQACTVFWPLSHLVHI